MTTGIYIFLGSILFIVAYILTKYFVNKKNLEQLSIENNLPNAVEETKEMVFIFFDDLKVVFEKQFKIFLHFILHFFVIVLGVISDLTDILYAKARDFFLKTATKEQQVVTKFWHHLKEYKREKEDEK